MANILASRMFGQNFKLNLGTVHNDSTFIILLQLHIQIFFEFLKIDTSCINSLLSNLTVCIFRSMLKSANGLNDILTNILMSGNRF